MRKAYISIAALLLCGSMLMAQTPANRTAKTTACWLRCLRRNKRRTIN